MKGTFFSADFATDKDENLRLIEINTDTGMVASQTTSFDWSDFINVLSGSNLTQVDVVYKTELQQVIIDNLSQSLALDAPFVTTFNPVVVPGDSIFPTAPAENGSNFVLRMAYDETSILDSEYAAGTLNLLTLFADNSDTGSIVNFYHSSSVHGYYNTLNTSIINGDALPDIVTKTIVENHLPHSFYKIGNSTSASVDRYNNFISTVATQDLILEQYHLNQSQMDVNQINSIRSFQIVYGDNLDLCYVAQYEIPSVFTLPTSINYDDTQISNLIDSKHYYEYASNTIKNQNHGVLGDELVVDVTGSAVEIQNLSIGDTYQSWYINGLPETDDYNVLDEYYITGSSLPSGSYLTASVCDYLYNSPTYANDMTRITFVNGNEIFIGGETRMLVYSNSNNEMHYVRVVDLDTTYSVLGENGSLNQISAIDVVIFNEPQNVWVPSMDPYDNFVLESGNFLTFYITHNSGISGSCFPKGTKILMADGSLKNIEDIEIGDEVLSFNEQTLKIEAKKVIGLKAPIHDDLVKYHFSNDTDLICTFDHPIYTNGLALSSFIPEWTNNRYDINKTVVKIKTGDMVRLSTGSMTAIKEIEILKPEDTQTHIITVEDNHNFFANNILVHNK
jgi:hypothetical protein